MGASMKSSQPLLSDDHVMGRSKCKRHRSPEQQAARAAKQAAHQAATLLVNQTTSSHGPSVGCLTGTTTVRNGKAKADSIVNLCGPSANAGNGPKQGIHNAQHKTNRERRANLDAAWRKDYEEACI